MNARFMLEQGYSVRMEPLVRTNQAATGNFSKLDTKNPM